MSDLAAIAYRRLVSTHLLGKKFTSAEEVVGWFGAVQSQDFPGAKWALGQRITGSTDMLIQQAFDDGRILRTHLMRPTWHFVLPEDIQWLRKLTADRVNAAMAYYYRQVDLDDRTFAKANELFAKTLQGGKQMTRPELKKELDAAGFDAGGLRMGFLVSHGELDGLLCSGAMKGKQHTYALLDERAPKGKVFSREEAIAELTRRYFISHGPAQVQDFAWWSGMSVGDAKMGVESIRAQLESIEVERKTYWFMPGKLPAKSTTPLVHLLPNYDEALVAYKDHAASLDPAVTVPINMLVNHLVVRDGQVIGGWRRKLAKNKTTVTATLPVALSKAEQQALNEAVAGFEAFLGHPVELITKP